MKKSFLTLIAFASIAISACGNKPNEQSANVTTTVTNKKADSTTTATITKMWWDKSQGLGGVKLSNGKSLSFSTDFLGENNAGRLFINAEVKDILFLDKEKAKDKLNLKYLDKKVKVTYDANYVIATIELLGGETPASAEAKISTGFIIGIKENYGYFIDFKNDNGETTNIRLYQQGNARPEVAPIFLGKGEKEDFVFYTKNYVLSLTNSGMQKKVKVTSEYKQIESNVNSGSRTEVFNENVVTKIEWAN